MLIVKSLKLLVLFQSKNIALRNLCHLKTVSGVTMNNSKIKISDRLSRMVLPLNYQVHLEPDFKNGTFTGSVDIQLNIKEERSSINLHSKDLNIKSVILLKNSNDIIEVSKFFEIKNVELLVINLEKAIMPGVYNVRIDFDGVLTGKIVGFYLSNLKNRTMVASKFEPTYARQAFPCFDEPDFKATFDISLVTPKSYIALSNMNEISKKRFASTDSEIVEFARSVPMSTYLACFVICDFASKETTVNSNGVGNDFILRSFAQKDQMQKIDFALDIGKRATEFYVGYYQVPFPLPKLDMIAIPDYVSGATEHWGLITYRETSFLIDEATASAANKISVANTIAHELAHMWFGNLVTMTWWNDLWLNEGFATYMQVKALNTIEPSWTMLDQFLTRTLHSVLVTDAKLSSHPIVQTVTTPDQITAIFDSISYNKGASVLRMLEGFVGEKNFQNGVTDYLKEFAYGNTITQNLLDSLEPYFKKDYPDLDITYIMDTWTKQMGYPLLDVQHGEKPNTYTVTQKRFLLDPNAQYENDSAFKYRWFVPITYTTNKGPNKGIIWFPDTVDQVTITIDSDETWIKINNNQVGYYRVNYPEDLWLEIEKQLQTNPNQLTLSDRAHLLNEAFALAEARVNSYGQALNLTKYLVNEDQYVPWMTAGSIFGGLHERLMNSLAYKNLLVYVQGLVKPLYAKYGTTTVKGDVIQTLLQNRILSLAASFELPEAVASLRSSFLEWLNSHDTNNPIQIDPDMRSTVYFYGMKQATMDEWEKLWAIYLKEEDAQELSKLRSALSAPLDANILRRRRASPLSLSSHLVLLSLIWLKVTTRSGLACEMLSYFELFCNLFREKAFLSLAWDENNIRTQDYLNVLGSISNNPSGTCLVWDDVRNRWPQLVERFTLNSRYLGNLIPDITNTFDTELKLKEMETFFAEYPDAGAGVSARRQALETVRNNIQWSQHNEPVIGEWLNKNAPVS